MNVAGDSSRAHERPIPLAENWRAQMLLEVLWKGPASTLDLQKQLPLVHVARQVWELRHWYGLKVKTGRLANGVALYSLIVEPPTVPRCPKCGNELRGVAPGLDAKFVTGVCLIDGKQTVRKA